MSPLNSSEFSRESSFELALRSVVDEVLRLPSALMRRTWLGLGSGLGLGLGLELKLRLGLRLRLRLRLGLGIRG